MNGVKRIIIFPQDGQPTTGMDDVLSHMESVNRTISHVDDYVTVKGVHSQVNLKRGNIKQFVNVDVEEFQDELLDSLSDGTGTSFLISKN